MIARNFTIATLNGYTGFGISRISVKQETLESIELCFSNGSGKSSFVL